MPAEVDEVQREWFVGKGVDALLKMGFSAGQRVLDFGCGPGRFSVPLSRVVGPGQGRVVAVDRNEKALQELQLRLADFGNRETVETILLQDDDGFGEVAGQTLDALLAFDVLQHVTDWDKFLQAAGKALRPEGILYVYPAAVPHPSVVDMEVVRSALVKLGFHQKAEYRLRLPHAESMVEDCVYAFQRVTDTSFGSGGPRRMALMRDREHYDQRYRSLRNEGAPGWTHGDDREIHHRELLRALDADYCPRAGHALDLGCGAGDWSMVLASGGFDVTGIDLSPEAIAWAEDKARHEGQSIDFRVGDVLHLDDLPSARFDFILDGFVLHCLIGRDRAQYLREARRLLKPGGLFFVHAFCAEDEDLTQPPFSRWVDPETRCHIIDGVARRYVARPDELLDELRAAELDVLWRKIVRIPGKMMHVHACPSE